MLMTLSIKNHENIQKASIHISVIIVDIGSETFKLLRNFLDSEVLIFKVEKGNHAY